MSESAIKLHLEKVENGNFLATSPDVPGLVAEGRTMTEAVEIAQGLARKILESCIEHGDEIPPVLMKMVDEESSSVDFTVPVPVK
ncbi:MAG: type II toxin-antitoxin system HicB family antitoxin [Nitrospinae bacterium]|nr:type II toxin-antitoxin system HicB family antitoxin [Nitrospinota bacterium]